MNEKDRFLHEKVDQKVQEIVRDWSDEDKLVYIYDKLYDEVKNDISHIVNN
jgi:hypothetical protein